MSTEAQKIRSRLGGAVQGGNRELEAQVRADLKAAKAEAYIRRLVAEAPRLTDEQRDRLAVLLRGSAA